jgi:hypothetical protein
VASGYAAAVTLATPVGNCSVEYAVICGGKPSTDTPELTLDVVEDKPAQDGLVPICLSAGRYELNSLSRDVLLLEHRMR